MAQVYKIDLFHVIGNDVMTSWWSEGSEWSGVNDGWADLGGSNADARITAVNRIPTATDLFCTGDDGLVYTAWHYAGGHWSSLDGDRIWRSLGGVFPPGAPIAAVCRTPHSIDLFAVGNDGQVYTSWWYEESDWSGLQGWRLLGGAFPAGGAVSAVCRTQQSIDLFAVGNDQKVHTAWWYEGHEWSVAAGWRDLGGSFPPGAPVAVTCRTDRHIDLFVAGNDRQMYTAWWSDGQEWSVVGDVGWRNLGGAEFPDRPTIAVVSRPFNLDLFVVSNDGRVYTSWWYEGQDWSSVVDGHWANLGGADLHYLNVHTTAVSRVVDEPSVTDAPITFEADLHNDSSTPVGGWAKLVLRPNGSTVFSGHIHGSGATSYDTSFAWVVTTPDGYAFTFTHSGHVAGTFESGSRDDDWTVHGSHPSIRDLWPSVVNASNHWRADIDLDIGDTLRRTLEIIVIPLQIWSVSTHNG